MYKQQKPLTVSSGILSLLITALVLAIAASANAQTSSTPLPATSTNTSLTSTTTATSTQTATTTSLEARLSAQKSDLERKQVELSSSTLVRKGILNEAKQAQVTELVGQYVTSISETILRLRNFSNRLEVEVADFSEQNTNVSTVANKINNANYLIREAETSLKDVNLNIQYTVTSATPQTDWIPLKSQLQLTNLFIRNAHVELNGILSNLREVDEEVSNPASTQ